MNTTARFFSVFLLSISVFAGGLIADDGGDLRRAASRGDLNRIRELVRAGVDINSRSGSGQTPLYRAARDGEPEAARLLLDLGADPNLPEEDGWAPLHTAAKRGYTEIIRILLENGADEHLETNSGRTAWRTAFNYDQFETVKFFALRSDIPAEMKARVRDGSLVIGGHRSGVFVRLWWYEAKDDTQSGRIRRLSQPLGADHVIQSTRAVDLVNPDGRILPPDSTGTSSFQMNTPMEVTERRPVFVGYIADVDQYYPYLVRYNQQSPSLDVLPPQSIRDAWLKDEGQFALNDPRLREVARSLRRGHNDYISLVHAVWDYVYKNMEYDTPPERPNSAAQVLDWGVGRCGEFTRLTIALMRAVGVPARQVNSAAAHVSGPDRRDHTWTEVYIPNFGWLPVQSQTEVPDNGLYTASFRGQYVESRGPDYRVHYSRRYDDVRRCRPYFGAGVFVPLQPGEREDVIRLIKRASVAGFYDAEIWEEKIASQPAAAQPLLYWLMVAAPHSYAAERSAQRLVELAQSNDRIDYERYFEFSPSIVKERLARIQSPPRHRSGARLIESERQPIGENAQ